MSLKTPDGQPAGLTDRIMVLASWCKKLMDERSKKLGDEKSTSSTIPPVVLALAMGKPTFPISQFAAQAGIVYWSKSLSQSQKARHLLSHGNGSVTGTHNRIAKMLAAIDYGDPRGDLEPRVKMAAALTKWYGNKVTIAPQNILFTTGGAGALHGIFHMVNKRVPNGLIVTPFPHYSLYAGSQKQNRLFPIPVMKEEDYRLTATVLSKYLKAATEQAKKEGSKVSAILICDPNNPLGTALDEDELQKIAEVLKDYPDTLIIIDEAYAEMRLKGKHEVSLLGVAPELKDRIILMRSATKALSAAGERMAITVAFTDSIMSDLIQENVNTYGHAPRSGQYVYAEAMENLDRIELENIRNFYKTQVEYGLQRLKKIGIEMPQSDRYPPDGAFYIMADLKDLFGQAISSEAARALDKRGEITTDEEIVYSLLFDDGVAVAPLSYFGVSNRCGYVRITCSGGKEELAELMDRLERRLVIARKEKEKRLLQKIDTILVQLAKVDKTKTTEFKKCVRHKLLYQSNPKDVTAKALKESNQALEALIPHIKKTLSAHQPEIKHKAAINIQSFFRGYRGRKQAKEWKEEMDSKWRAFVNVLCSSDKARKMFYNWPPSERLEFKPWVEYLQKNYPTAGMKIETAIDSPPRLPIVHSKL